MSNLTIIVLDKMFPPSKHGEQLGLDITIPPDYSVSKYFWDRSEASPLKLLLHPEVWGGSLLCVAGESGSGKTHLAHIFTDHFAVPMLAGNQLCLEMLPALAQKGCAIDDVEEVDDVLLFHLLNLIEDNTRKILLTSKFLPSQRSIVLPDLNSRLLQGATLTLPLPNDTTLQSVMLKHFMDRKLRVTSDVVNYLLLRIPRSYSDVARCVQFIDTKALQEKATITIPFVRKVLQEFYPE